MRDINLLTTNLLRHQTAALKLGLGLVPGPGHAIVGLPGIVVTDISDHLRFDRVLHLLPEDVGQYPAHCHHHEEEEHEDGVGEE